MKTESEVQNSKLLGRNKDTTKDCAGSSRFSLIPCSQNFVTNCSIPDAQLFQTHSIFGLIGQHFFYTSEESEDLQFNLRLVFEIVLTLLISRFDWFIKLLYI